MRPASTTEEMIEDVYIAIVDLTTRVRAVESALATELNLDPVQIARHLEAEKEKVRQDRRIQDLRAQVRSKALKLRLDGYVRE
jgi:hypothetical protein